MQNKNKVEDATTGPAEAKKAAPELGMIEFSRFFTFVTVREKVLIIIGTISAMCAGFLLPCIALAMGAVTNTFNPMNSNDEILR